MPRATSTFRICGNSFFLTYPQTNHDVADELLTFFKSLRDYQGCVIGKELHEDGSEHLHALVQFCKRIDSTRQSFFDVAGRHPNIQVARRPSDVYKYVTKDGNFIKDGELTRIGRTKESFEEAIQEALTKESLREAIQFLKQTVPATFARNYGNISKFLNDHFSEKPIEYVSEYTFENTSPVIQEWVEDNVNAVGKFPFLASLRLITLRSRAAPFALIHSDFL